MSERRNEYTDWLKGVGRQMQAARVMFRALSDMRDIEAYDRIKADAAMDAWVEACHPYPALPPADLTPPPAHDPPGSGAEFQPRGGER